ncbi:bleomycin hydrolase-like [Tubulanus polymorphus]|uniref:bleomycin hydrolase-like n=1 Tax=Tubulanus polymorphus TaxID=672921 RepID=UPI003DA235D1
MASTIGISSDDIAAYRKTYAGNPKNKLSEAICHKYDFIDFCMTGKHCNAKHVFKHKIAEVKPISNQKATGRCWIFALLNAARVPFMKHFEIDDFEFSQGYIFFWDKVERANYTLHTYLECAKKKEPVDGRLVQYLLHNPAEDGGQWDMMYNIINKHGLVPKSVWPESYCTENSRRINSLLCNKMREFCRRLYKLVENEATDEQIETERKQMMEQIFHVCSIAFGCPPETFTWEYYNKDTPKSFKKLGPISPHDFYHEHVKPHFNIFDKICIVNDPRKTSPYNEMYTVQYLGNMMGGRPTLYNNQDIEVLKKAAADSIKEGEPVWFGCDVGKFFHRVKGINDPQAFDYNLLFGVTVQELDKADRLIFGESMMTHAMVLTGLSEDEDGKPTKWRVENSWGEDGGDKGYMAASDEWFSEYVYEVVVDKKFLPKTIVDIQEKAPIILPAWDPMGALAC